MDMPNKNVTLDDLAVTMAEGFAKVNENHESLARMVAKGFTDMDEKIDEKFKQVDEKFKKADEKFEKIENEIQALRSSVNNYLQFSDKRYLELKAREKVIVSWVRTIADKTGVQINFEDLEKVA